MLEKVMENITGIVLARGGSKGIHMKNLLNFDGKSLLERSILVMKQSGCLQDIWVSTDNDKIAECAKNCGACVHMRAAYTATDEASSLIAMQEFLKVHSDVQTVCLVQCTSPFLKPEYLQKGAAKMTAGFDSVFAVTRQHHLRWSEDLPTIPLNFNPALRPRRQDWAGELCENGMFYFARAALVAQSLLQGGRCSYIEIPIEDSLEIDSPFDLLVAQQYLCTTLASKSQSNLIS